MRNMGNNIREELEYLHMKRKQMIDMIQTMPPSIDPSRVHHEIMEIERKIDSVERQAARGSYSTSSPPKIAKPELKAPTIRMKVVEASEKIPLNVLKEKASSVERCFNKVKRDLAKQLANQLLDTLDYDIKEDHSDGVIIIKVKTSIILEDADGNK